MGKFEYADKSKPFLDKLEAKVEIALDATGDFFAQTIQDQMPGAGASVVAGTGGDTGVKGKYVPSSPGSPPGVRSNRLKSSITSQKAGRLRRAVGTNVSYARIQEFGGTINHPGGTAYVTSGGSAEFVSLPKSVEGVRRTGAHTITLPARPFMSPGYEAAKKPGFRVFTNTLKKGMK